MDTATRAKGAREHYEKYEAMAQLAGVENIKHTIALFGITADEVKRAVRTNKHLNNIDLGRWDAMVGALSDAVARGNKASGRASAYSIAECVSLAKHVAKYHTAKSERPVYRTDGKLGPVLTMLAADACPAYVCNTSGYACACEEPSTCDGVRMMKRQAKGGAHGDAQGG